MSGYIDLALRAAGAAGALSSAVLAALWKQQRRIWELEKELQNQRLAAQEAKLSELAKTQEEKFYELAQCHNKQQDLVNRFLERLVEAETLSRTMSRTVEQLGRTVQGLTEVLARLDGRIGRGGE